MYLISHSDIIIPEMAIKSWPVCPSLRGFTVQSYIFSLRKGTRLEGSVKTRSDVFFHDRPHICYSGTSDKGPSEKSTVSLQRTVHNIPKRSFPIAIIFLQLREED